MKKGSLFVLILFLVGCGGNSQNGTGRNKLKRYGVQSGMVEYKTSISGTAMGGTVKGSGTEYLYFKDWGAVELRETKSKQTTTVNVLGMKKTETTQTHTMDKLDNGKTYSVDFEEKVIYTGNDMAMNMMKKSGTHAGKAGKEMLKSLGGKKIGTGKVLGYTCEVWSIPGGKLWTYKDVVLKTDITVMGIRTLTEAVSAKFNVAVPAAKFKLPAFPEKNMDEMMGGMPDNDSMFGDDMDKDDEEYLRRMENMSFEEWKKMAKEDEELKDMSDEELRRQYDMMKQMLKAYKHNK